MTDKREQLAKALARATGSMDVVRSGAAARSAYASDASIYRAVPAVIVEPRGDDDVGRVLDVVRREGVPVTARGGGTSVAGNAIGDGIVLDFSVHMNQIVDIRPEERRAVVQPGVVLDDLRAAASEHGLTFGPDPSTHSRCTLGGMIGNNACGTHSVAWGSTADNLLGLTHLLTDGRQHTAGKGTAGDPQIDEALMRLRSSYLAQLRTELGRFSRQVSGYALHHLLPENGFDVAKALAGSESTCGVMTSATVRLVREAPAKVLLVLGFSDVFAAARTAPQLAREGALTVEGMASDLIEALRARRGEGAAGTELPAGRAWLYCEFGGADQAQARAAAVRAAEGVRDRGCRVSRLLVERPEHARELWRIRESGAGIVTRLPDGGEAWPGWEDSAVPPERLAGYLEDLYGLLDRYGLRAVPFGHFGEGCVHLRAGFELGTERGVDRYRAFVTDAADLVATHGGSISGEHGDGRARSALLPAMYSETVRAAFRDFKEVFDDVSLLNPGVLTEPAPVSAAIRPGPGHNALELTPVHSFQADGGSFSRAVNRCVGLGACRDVDNGSMCPSYAATRDEVHSTRGRARVLAEMLRGETVSDGWRSTEVRDALDLCLSCKACAKECPVNVDMATYKAEFLYHHYARRLRPRAHLSMGWLPLWSRLITAWGPIARLVNAALARPVLAAIAKRAGGLEPRRSLPRFTERPFACWFRGAARRRRGGDRGEDAHEGRPTVVLWPDTFTNFHDPEVGHAAAEVLGSLGYRVELPAAPVCCGLTWHSTGQLGVATRVLIRSLDALQSQLAAGYPVIGLEPSCTVMLRDEARALLPNDARAARLAVQMQTLPELLASHEGEWPFARLDAGAVAQVHCHQEAKGSYTPDRAVLGKLGVHPDVVESGCCGLAGNFGFERGHWDVSQACAERELYPKVRAARPEDLVLADGFSCRTQIAQGSARRGMHIAEVLRSALRR